MHHTEPETCTAKGPYIALAVLAFFVILMFASLPPTTGSCPDCTTSEEAELYRTNEAKAFADSDADR